jgi:hypothetical protein
MYYIILYLVLLELVHTCRLPTMGTGTGIPRVQKIWPTSKPVPTTQVQVIDGYGYGYNQKYPRVTRAEH